MRADFEMCLKTFAQWNPPCACKSSVERCAMRQSSDYGSSSRGCNKLQHVQVPLICYTWCRIYSHEPKRAANRLMVIRLPKISILHCTRFCAQYFRPSLVGEVSYSMHRCCCQVPGCQNLSGMHMQQCCTREAYGPVSPSAGHLFAG